MNDVPLPIDDSIYKRLYPLALMVEDLLRSLFADAELGADYRTLELLPAEYVGDAFQQRRGDTAWRLRPRRSGGSLTSSKASGREEGISLGREQGIGLGVEYERQLLRRQAAARFDSATAERLAATIGAETDPQRLEDVGEAIVRCATSGELLRKIGSHR